MKLNFKMTRKKFGILLLIVIIVPIIYNKTASLITGLITAQFMKMPKEVVAGYPQYKNDYVSAQATGRVEAIYSIDVMARVPGS